MRLALEVLVVPARRWPALAFVLRAELARAVRDVGARGHLDETDLADLHTGIERDWQVCHIREFEREVAVPTSVNEPGSGVDQEAETPKRRLTFDAPDQVVRQPNTFERRAECEFARVKHEGLTFWDFHLFCEVGLVLLHVDDATRVVLEDTKGVVEMEVDRRRLDTAGVEWVDDDAPSLELGLDGAVGENHAEGRLAASHVHISPNRRANARYPCANAPVPEKAPTRPSAGTEMARLS